MLNCGKQCRSKNPFFLCECASPLHRSDDPTTRQTRPAHMAWMVPAMLSRPYRVMPGGIRWAVGRLYLGWPVPTLYRCRALVGRLGRGQRAVRQLRGKVRMMTDVACFCGCVYSFYGHAGACPGCGEVATLTVGRASAGTERGQQEQPRPAANGHGRGGQAATLREWAELIPGSPSRHRDERQHVPGRDRPENRP
jgi:hypothetical protein